MTAARGKGTRDDPRALNTPPGTSAFTAYRDETLTVGKTELRYHLRCLKGLHGMLRQHEDWMLLGSADEQEPAAPGTVEAWARSPKNPVGGWYGPKTGLRGRFAMCVPPVMDAVKLAEVVHNPRNHRMRAI